MTLDTSHSFTEYNARVVKVRVFGTSSHLLREVQGYGTHAQCVDEAARLNAEAKAAQSDEWYEVQKGPPFP
jgi:hypothetical protein